MKCRTKPIEYDGFQMTQANRAGVDGWPDWAAKARTLPHFEPGAMFGLSGKQMLATEDGAIVIEDDDWVLRAADGAIHIAAAAWFTHNYELVESV